MSELLQWFADSVQPRVERPRARNYANFVTSLHTLEELLQKQASASCFIETFEKMQSNPPYGHDNKPGVIQLRRRFEWINGRGILDISQGVNGVRRPYTMDSLLTASIYHIPTREWHIGFFTESQPFGPHHDDNNFPFPSLNFHAVSFTKKPDFATFLLENPAVEQALRPLSIPRRDREPTRRTIGECFIRRVVRGSSLNNMAFPHL